MTEGAADNKIKLFSFTSTNLLRIQSQRIGSALPANIKNSLRGCGQTEESEAASFLTLRLQLTRCEGFALLQHAALVLQGNEVHHGQLFDSGFGGHASKPITSQEDAGHLQLHLHNRAKLIKSLRRPQKWERKYFSNRQLCILLSFMQSWQVTSLSNFNWTQASLRPAAFHLQSLLDSGQKHIFDTVIWWELLLIIQHYSLTDILESGHNWRIWPILPQFHIHKNFLDRLNQETFLLSGLSWQQQKWCWKQNHWWANKSLTLTCVISVVAKRLHHKHHLMFFVRTYDATLLRRLIMLVHPEQLVNAAPLRSQE